MGLDSSTRRPIPPAIPLRDVQEVLGITKADVHRRESAPPFHVHRVDAVHQDVGDLGVEEEGLDGSEALEVMDELGDDALAIEGAQILRPRLARIEKGEELGRESPVVEPRNLRHVEGLDDGGMDLRDQLGDGLLRTGTLARREACGGGRGIGRRRGGIRAWFRGGGSGRGGGAGAAAEGAGGHGGRFPEAQAGTATAVSSPASTRSARAARGLRRERGSRSPGQPRSATAGRVGSKGTTTSGRISIPASRRVRAPAFGRNARVWFCTRRNGPARLEYRVEAGEEVGSRARAEPGRLDDEDPRVDGGEDRDAGGRVVEPVDEHEVRAALQLDEQLADRPYRGQGRGDRAPGIAVDRDPIRALRPHPVRHLRVQRRPGGRAEKLGKPRRRLDVEQEREGGEGPVEIEHRDVAAALGRDEGGGGGEGRRAAPAGPREAHRPAARGAVRGGAASAGRRIAHRGRGDRLHQVVVHPGEEDLPAEAGGPVRAEGDDHRPDLAHRGELVDRAGRICRPVEVHEEKRRGTSGPESRQGGGEAPRPDVAARVGRRVPRGAPARCPGPPRMRGWRGRRR